MPRNGVDITFDMSGSLAAMNFGIADFAYALHFMKPSWQRYPFADVVEKEFSLSQTRQAFDYAVEHKPLRVGIQL